MAIFLSMSSVTVEKVIYTLVKTALMENNTQRTLNICFFCMDAWFNKKNNTHTRQYMVHGSRAQSEKCPGLYSLYVQ